MFEQTFKNIDDVLWKDAGCTSELDYTEQTSWLLFLKYLDDLETARATGSLFFPIIPGAENASWIELREEGLQRVLNGTFSGSYQADLINRFNAVLSPVPPWVL